MNPTQAVSRLLGVELCELPDWNCCGASSAHVTDESLAHSLVARNLAIAEKQGMDVVVPCAACYSRFKAGEKEKAGGTEAGKEAELPGVEPSGVPRRRRAFGKDRGDEEAAAHRAQGGLLLRLPTGPSPQSDRSEEL